jgi:membrane-associated protein
MLPAELTGNLAGLVFEGHGDVSLCIYPILFIIILLENGVPPMIWLPGDSLLFLSGMLAAGTLLNLYLLLGTFILAAATGYQINYYLGEKLGLPLITTHFSQIITQKNLKHSEDFYQKWGNSAVTIGRFIPVIRTMTPFLAGLSRMDLRKFTGYNILGALIWPPIVCGSGYLCGIIPDLILFRDQIFSIVSFLFGLSILASFILIIITWLRTR